MRFEDEVVVITGGGGGIGSALYLGFAAEGAAVAVADVNLEAAQKVAPEISRSDGKDKAWSFDVSNRLAVEKAAGDQFALTARGSLYYMLPLPNAV